MMHELLKIWKYRLGAVAIFTGSTALAMHFVDRGLDVAKEEWKK